MVIDALIVAVLVVPIVVAAVRALAAGYYPVSDNAVLTLRAWDTFSAHPPLLGSGSSASLVVAAPVSNPGPWYGYFVAVPVRVLGPASGGVIGVAALNATAIIVAGGQARAAGGRIALGAVGVAVATLLVGMGPLLMWDIWQPHATLLPFVAFAVSLWALVGSDRGHLALTAALGSLLAQTHLTYVVLAGVGVVVAIGLTLARWRRGPRRERPRAGRQLVLAGGVLVVMWVPPLIEQFTGGGRGNLSRLFERDASSKVEALGWARAFRALGTQVVHPWITRTGFSEPGALVSAAAATGVVIAVVAALGAVAVVGHLQRDRRAWAAGIVGIGLLVLAVATAQLIPFGPFGIANHQLRFLTPVLASALAFMLAGSARLLRTMVTRPIRSVFGRLLVVVIIASAGVAVTPSAHPTGLAHGGTQVGGVARALADDVAAADVVGPVRYDGRYFFFGEYYAMTVLLALVSDGEEVHVDDGLTIQLGEHRRTDGSEVGVITVVQGDAAMVTPPGARRVAFVQDVSVDALTERAALRARPAAELDAVERQRLEELDDEFLNRTVAVFYEPTGAAGGGG